MVIQETKTSCGKACVRELMTLLFHDESFAYMEVEEACQDFYSIRVELEKHGVRMESVELSELRKVEHRRLPMIAQVNRNGTTHFLLVRKIGKKTISVSDPQFGEYDLSIQDFLTEFMGKAMLFTSKGKKPKKPKLNLIHSSESFLYLALFFYQSVFTVLLLLYSMAENSFAYTVSFAGCLLIGIVLQSVLNWRVRRKMDDRVLLPYLKANPKQEDFPRLSIVLTESVKQYSGIVSYGTVSVGFITMLLLNNVYLSYLALLALLFTVLRYPIVAERNAASRYCSLEEANFLRNMETTVGQSHYLAARKKANHLLSEIVGIWCVEAMMAAVLILAQMGISKENSVNTFVYYFGLTLALSVIFERLFHSMFCQEKKIQALNGLSVPLTRFFLQDNINIVYNNGTTKKGANEDAETKTHS